MKIFPGQLQTNSSFTLDRPFKFLLIFCDEIQFAYQFQGSSGHWTQGSGVPLLLDTDHLCKLFLTLEVLGIHL